MRGTGAAAAPHNVDPTLFEVCGQGDSHGFRGLVVFTKLVGETGIGVNAHRTGGQRSQFFQVRLHLGSTKAAVHADTQQFDMGNGGQKGFERLARQGTPAGVGHGNGDHDR